MKYMCVCVSLYKSLTKPVNSSNTRQHLLYRVYGLLSLHRALQNLYIIHSPTNVLLLNLEKFKIYINPYPTAFPYGNGMVLHFYQQQESSTTKIVHKVINKGLKTYVYSFILVRISIKLQAPRFFYIGTDVSLLFRESFLYI